MNSRHSRCHCCLSCVTRPALRPKRSATMFATGTWLCGSNMLVRVLLAVGHVVAAGLLVGSLVALAAGGEAANHDAVGVGAEQALAFEDARHDGTRVSCWAGWG